MDHRKTKRSIKLLCEISDIVQPVRSDGGKSEPYNWDNSFGDHTIF
jgi:hypothetical protein